MRRRCIMTDPREAAARYRARQRSRGDDEDDSESGAEPGIAAATDRAAFIETAIQVAIRRGDFDDLPGAGKPLEGLGTHHDPDWWIRRKIEQENLTGLGPPAILLRTEDRELDDQLDLLGREADVRSVLEDFNGRVLEARRQLQGGPPVVTSPRDIDAEVAAWAERRSARFAARAAETPEQPRRRRFGLRRRA
ncbi:molecular chaperone DnaJ [Microbacterium sp. CGR1]|nr:molecular chaperone DnaJ [Microbacterium sp. CGR1]